MRCRKQLQKVNIFKLVQPVWLLKIIDLSCTRFSCPWILMLNRRTIFCFVVSFWEVNENGFSQIQRQTSLFTVAAPTRCLYSSGNILFFITNLMASHYKLSLNWFHNPRLQVSANLLLFSYTLAIPLISLLFLLIKTFITSKLVVIFISY